MIYLLSILDGIGGACLTLAVVSGFAMLACGVIALVTAGEFDEETRAVAVMVRKVGPKAAWTFALSLAAVALAPSSESLLRAYIMVEGSQLVTAKNGEKAAAEIVKRVDTLISKIGGGK